MSVELKCLVFFAGMRAIHVTVIDYILDMMWG